MKKTGITLTILFIIIVVVAVGIFNGQTKGEKEDFAETTYFRLHIRANSNSNLDQQVKYEIKENVVEFLTPYVQGCKSKEEAMIVIKSLSGEVENIIDKILIKKGFSYKSSCDLRREYFPTRVYQNETLQAGEYDSLIINLGSGKGDNWWCVIYPPLCFTGENNSEITYKSKMIELFKKIFN